MKQTWFQEEISRPGRPPTFFFLCITNLNGETNDSRSREKKIQKLIFWKVCSVSPSCDAAVVSGSCLSEPQGDLKEAAGWWRSNSDEPRSSRSLFEVQISLPPIQLWTLYTIRCCFRLIKAPLRATRLQNESVEKSRWTLDHLQLFSRCPESGVFHRKEENLHPFLWFTDFYMLHCHVSTVAQKRQTKHWLYRGPFVVSSIWLVLLKNLIYIIIAGLKCWILR